jgi:hypothetical protein
MNTGPMKNSVIRCFALLSFLGVCSAAPGVLAPSTDSRGAVACESKVCSQIGIELLERGVRSLLCAESFWRFFEGKGLIM